MDFRLKTFAAEAAVRCAFLVSDHGFTGPETTREERGLPTVTVLYTREDAVVTTMLALYYMGHQMRKALDRQVADLRALLAQRSGH